LEDSGNPEGTTKEEVEAEYKKPKHVNLVAQRLLFPEFAVRKAVKIVKDTVVRVLEGEQHLHHM